MKQWNRKKNVESGMSLQFLVQQLKQILPGSCRKHKSLREADDDEQNTVAEKKQTVYMIRMRNGSSVSVTVVSKEDEIGAQRGESVI